jgi:hypothetical protein
MRWNPWCWPKPLRFSATLLATNADINVIRAAKDHITDSIDIIADLATSAGIPQSAAQTYAADCIAKLQGALMLLASLGDTSFFTGPLQNLSELADQAAHTNRRK